MRLLLAAGKAHFRLALELLLSEQPGVEIVGSASEGDGLLALMETSDPDMIVAEWDLLGRPLATIFSERDQSCPHLKMIILTTSNRDRQAAIAAGADASVLKGASPDLLLSTFRELRTQITANQEVDRYE